MAVPRTSRLLDRPCAGRHACKRPPTADAATLLLDVATDWKTASKITQPRVVALVEGQPAGGVIGRNKQEAHSAAGLILD